MSDYELESADNDESGGESLGRSNGVAPSVIEARERSGFGRTRERMEVKYLTSCERITYINRVQNLNLSLRLRAQGFLEDVKGLEEERLRVQRILRVGKHWVPCV